jgi:hypothetical protein
VGRKSLPSPVEPTGRRARHLSQWRNQGARAFLGFRKANGVGVVVLSNSAQLANRIDRVGLIVLGKLNEKK